MSRSPADDCPASPDVDALYRQSRARLVTFAWLLLGSREAAEDVVQEAFVRFSLSAAARSTDQPDAYLRTIVLNLVRDERRRALVAWRHRPAPHPPVLPAEHAGLWDLCHRLPPRQRAAIALRYYFDLPVAEIAAQLGCPEGTVKAAIHRGLQKLRKELDDGDR